MHETRLKNNQAIGKLLGDAVRSSIQTLFMIGGFIILFSVFNRLLYVTNMTDMLAHVVQYVLAIFHLPRELSVPFIAGVFEITLGSQMASEATNATLLEKVIITSFILAFGGFSVQAQVASILAEANIRFQPFFIARIFHGLFAAFFASMLWKPLYVQPLESAETLPVWLPKATIDWPVLYIHWIEQYGFMITATACLLYVAIAFDVKTTCLKVVFASENFSEALLPQLWYELGNVAVIFRHFFTMLELKKSIGCSSS